MFKNITKKTLWNEADFFFITDKKVFIDLIKTLFKDIRLSKKFQCTTGQGCCPVELSDLIYHILTDVEVGFAYDKSLDSYELIIIDVRLNTLTRYKQFFTLNQLT